MKQLLLVLQKVSTLASNHYVQKNQNEVERFVFAGIEKIRKNSLVFIKLYPEMDANEEIEFSLGILGRSILMDMILVLGIKNIYIEFEGINSESFRNSLKEYCYKIISDGTKHFIDEIFSSNNLSLDEKKKLSLQFASVFSKAFDTCLEKPKLNKDFKIVLQRIIEDCKDYRLVNRDVISNLYSYYSKYDHLSNWTPVSSHIPFEQRKGKIELAIILIVMHLIDLLIIAKDFDNSYESLIPYIDELEKSLNDENISKFFGN